MNPGALNQKIEIRRAAQTDDGMGGSTSVVSAILACWAQIKTPKSRDGIIAGKDLDIRTHEVTIRHTAVEPKRGDIVIWSFKTLKIGNVREDKAFYYLDCIQEG